MAHVPRRKSHRSRRRQRTEQGSGIHLAALVLLLMVTSAALLTLYAKEDGSGPLHTMQLGAAEVLKPVRGAVGTVTEPLRATVGRVTGAFDNSDEKALQEKLSETQGLAARTSFLERENARLRELIKGERSFYEYGPLARVVAPVSDRFTDRVTIDVGSEDGIKPQMPVVIGQNTLIGRTTNNVSRTTSQVMLVTDREFAAGVRIIPPAHFDPSSGRLSPAITGGDDEAAEVSYGEGMLRTNLEGYFGIEFVDLGSRAEKGDYVVTKGWAGERELLFPPGLYVGTIESVSSQDSDQYKKIVVEPAMDPDDLEEVRVITDW